MIYDIDAVKFLRPNSVRVGNRDLGKVVPLGFEYPDQPAPLATVRCDAALGDCSTIMRRGRLEE
jgi:hypothetical protein